MRYDHVAILDEAVPVAADSRSPITDPTKPICQNA